MKEFLCLGNDLANLANLHGPLMKFLFEIVVLIRKIIRSKGFPESRNIYLKYIPSPNCDEIKVT